MSVVVLHMPFLFFYSFNTHIHTQCPNSTLVYVLNSLTQHYCKLSTPSHAQQPPHIRRLRHEEAKGKAGNDQRNNRLRRHFDARGYVIER